MSDVRSGEAGGWNIRTAAIIIAVVVLDYLTKIYIRGHFSGYDIRVVIPGLFNIVHAENPGAAFSMLADAGPWRSIVLIGISLVMLAVIGYLLRKPSAAGLPQTAWAYSALALVFGGALGNLFDRAFRGTVTDFIQVFIGTYEFPSFNVADSAITVGACLLLLVLWTAGRRTHGAGEPTERSPRLL